MRRPNVIMILADQHRWDFMGYEANDATHTPHLNALAEDGASFGSCYCTSPLCSPSRASIISGRYGANTGCFTNLQELPPLSPTFANQFRLAGYQTCAVGKMHMRIHAYDSDLTSNAQRAYMDSLGWDETVEVSGDDMFRHGIRCAYSEFLKDRGALDQALEFYEQWHYFMEPQGQGDPSFKCHEWPLSKELHGTSFIAQEAISWIEAQDASKPFFLYIGFSAPHSPIAPLPRYMDLYRHTPEQSPWDNPAPPSWIAESRRGYRALISHIDQCVGDVKQCLSDNELLENSVILYAADHGELAGDHGYFDKCSFFEPAVRVPLVISGPDIRRGIKSNALVETMDIGATHCDVCLVPTHSLDQGRSVAPILRHETTAHRETVYSELGCDKMLRTDRYKFMWGDPRRDHRQLGRLHLDRPANIPPSPLRIFDLVEDPCELTDLGDGTHSDLQLQLAEQLLIRINENTQAQPLMDRGNYQPLSSRRRQGEES